jgi:hypothetical protein
VTSSRATGSSSSSLAPGSGCEGKSLTLILIFLLVLMRSLADLFLPPSQVDSRCFKL